VLRGLGNKNDKLLRYLRRKVGLGSYGFRSYFRRRESGLMVK